MPRPKKARDEEPRTRAGIRSRLLKDYEEAFGRTWPEAPWGGSWTDFLDDARRADDEYEEAVVVLEELASALGKFRSLVERRSFPRLSPEASLAKTLETMIGFTGADHCVAVLAGAKGDVLAEVEADARALATMLRAKPEEIIAQAPESVGESICALNIALGEAYRHGERDVLNFEDSSVARTRRLYRQVIRAKTGAVSEFVQPGVPGPPPERVHAWRRGFLVQLLDLLPVLTDGRPASNRDIAVVSLLFEGLEKDVLDGRINRGFKHVIERERNAIAAARRERTFFTRRLYQAGIAGDGGVSAKAKRAVTPRELVDVFFVPESRKRKRNEPQQ